MSINWDSVSRLLDRNLDGDQVSERKGGSGKMLSYIEGWFAIAEANRIFGHGGWCRETIELKLVTEKPIGYFAKVRVTVDNVVREGCGWGGDATGKNDHEKALKEAETDATKRALMTFGWPFGLALYDPDKTHVTNGNGTVTVTSKAPTITRQDVNDYHKAGGPSEYASRVPGQLLDSLLRECGTLDDIGNWWDKHYLETKDKINHATQCQLTENMIKKAIKVADSAGALQKFKKDFLEHINYLEKMKPAEIEAWWESYDLKIDELSG